MGTYNLGIKKWDLTIESPTKFFRALEDILQDDLHYSITFEEKPELRRTAIEGTAKFEGLLRGMKTFYKMSAVKIILGIISMLMGITLLFYNRYYSSYLIFGFTLLVIGIILVAKMKSLSSMIINIKIEGESYKASVGKETDKEIDRDRTERVGIISDGRLTINPRIEGKYGNKEIQLLNQEMKYLFKKVEKELIPQYTLPKIKQ